MIQVFPAGGFRNAHEIMVFKLGIESMEGNSGDDFLLKEIRILLFKITGEGYHEFIEGGAFKGNDGPGFFQRRLQILRLIEV